MVHKRQSHKKLQSVVNVAVFLFILCSLLVAVYLGGPSLLAILLASIIYSFRDLHRGTPSYLSLLKGLSYSILSVFIIGAFVPQLLKTCSWSRTNLFQTTSYSTPLIAGEFTYTKTVELHQTVAIFMGLMPALIAFIVVGRYVARRPDVKWEEWTIAIRKTAAPMGILIVPFLVVAYYKFSDSSNLLAAIMKGDGRNFYLTVENIRLTSEFTEITSVMGQGNFAPSLAAFLSAGQGGIGRFAIQDLYSIAATYVLLAGLILISFATYTHQFVLLTIQNSVESDQTIERKNTPLFWPLIAAVGFVIASFGPVMNEIFRSGFLSLYGAMSIVSLYLAISSVRPSNEQAFLKVIAVLFLSVTYPLAIGAILLPALRDLILYIKTKRLVVISTAVLPIVALYILQTRSWNPILEKIQARALLEGGIKFIDNRLLLVVLFVACFSWLVFQRTALRLITEDVALVVVSGMIVSYLLTELREPSQLVGAGYYGEKNDYLVYFVIFYLTCVMTVVAISHLCAFAISSTRSLFFTLLVRFSPVPWSIACLLFAGIFYPSQTMFWRHDEWFQPTASSVEFALNNWKKSDVIYLDPSDPGEARITNFWLPYFWRSHSIGWLYNSFSSDPLNVCSILATVPAKITTPDARLEQSLRDECPEYILNP